MTAVRCDLVVPVYNALRSTRDCLASLKRFAPSWARIVVVNDGSDAWTTGWLREQQGIVLLENPVNLGFVKTANRGLVFSDAPYVCLVNSDTLFTEGAVERMVARMDADRSIALCCPVSNGAVNLSVRVPEGTDVFTFGRRVGRTSPALYPDAVTVVGFCLMFRREVIRALGVFDDVFDRGYCEETDYHYRCRAAGWRCVVADDAFVYHRHEGSFTDRDARFARNLEILMARWRRLHERELATFNARNALGAIRDERFEWRLPDDAPAPHDVLFVLSSVHAPGAASVLQLADALLMRGTTANVLVLDAAAPSDVELFFRPLHRDPELLRGALPPARTVVATDEASAAALALALDGQHEPLVGLLEAAPVGREVRAFYPARASFDPHPQGAFPLPPSPEPDLFYPRDSREGAFRLAAAAPEALSGFAAETFVGLPREKRAALFGRVHAVLDLRPDSAMTALEAMAAGAVPVLARGSTAESLAADGVDALFVDMSGAAGAPAVLARLRDDAALRGRLAAAGFASARGRTWAAAAEAFTAWSARLVPPAALDAAAVAALTAVVRARPRPPAPPTPAREPRIGLRARLGRLKRRLL